jgi:hypothetical protein
LAWIVILLFMLPAAAGVTGTHCCTQLLVKTGFHQFFARAGLKQQS